MTNYKSRYKAQRIGSSYAAFQSNFAQQAYSTRRGNRAPPKSRFRRDWLPSPADYYREQGLTLTGRGPWRDALCPFHDDHSPSLRVNIETGKFRCMCMACGAHGDMIDFHRKRYGLDFVAAAKALGAWEGA